MRTDLISPRRRRSRTSILQVSIINVLILSFVSHLIIMRWKTPVINETVTWYLVKAGFIQSEGRVYLKWTQTLFKLKADFIQREDRLYSTWRQTLSKVKVNFIFNIHKSLCNTSIPKKLRTHGPKPTEYRFLNVVTTYGLIQPVGYCSNQVSQTYNFSTGN